MVSLNSCFRSLTMGRVGLGSSNFSSVKNRPIPLLSELFSDENDRYQPGRDTYIHNEPFWPISGIRKYCVISAALEAQPVLYSKMELSLIPCKIISGKGTPSSIVSTTINYNCVKFGAFVSSVTIKCLGDLTKIISSYIIWQVVGTCYIQP